MSDSPEILQIAPVRTQLSWHGRFPQPVFSVFVNPAPTYAALYRLIQQYGADLNSIGIDVTVLAQAQITCTILPLNAILKIRLEQVEIALLNVGAFEPTLLADFVDGVKRALLDVDSSFAADVADVSVDVWASIESGSYADWVRRYVSLPEGLAGSEPSFRFEAAGKPYASLLVERARAHVDRGLYYRYSTTFPGGPAVAQLGEARRRPIEMLRQLGVFQQ